MPPTIDLFCHLERLGPTYKTGYVDFTLNLTAAFSSTPATGDVEKYLLPSVWNFAADQAGALALYTVAADGTFSQVAGEMVADTTSQLNSVRVAALQAEIGNTASAWETNVGLAPFAWSTTVPPALGDDTYDWRSWIAHLSTYPDGLGRALNLSISFRILATSIQNKTLIAAPIFSNPSGSGFAAMPITPPTATSCVPQPVNGYTVYLWQYVPSTVTILAHTQASPPPTAVVTVPVVDPGKLWVTLTDQTVATGLATDWTNALESQIVDTFDLSQHLLNGLRTNVARLLTSAPDITTVWSIDQTFHDAFIACLRDTANLGLTRTPDGVSLAEYTVSHFSQSQLSVPSGFDPDQWDLVNVLRSTEPSDATIGWAAAVATANLPSFPGIPPAVNNPAFATFVANAQVYLNALQGFHSSYAADHELASAIYDAWSSAFTSLPSTDPRLKQWSMIASSVEVWLESLPLRRMMLLGCEGGAWSTIVNGLADLGGTIVTALSGYLAQRLSNPAPHAYPVDPQYADYLPSAPLPTDSKFAADVQSSFLQSAKDTVARISPQPSQPTSTTEALVLPIGTPGGADDKPYLEQISGTGLMLQRTDPPNSPWRCHSLAQMIDSAGDVLSNAATPIPIRLHARNGLVKSALKYDNHPMVGTSPAAQLAQNNKVTVPNQQALSSPSLVQYRSLYGTSVTSPLLEALVYGRSYNAAVFLMSTGGYLPSELATGDVGTGMIPWAYTAPGASVSLPGQAKITFLRSVPVGRLRLGPASALWRQISVPLAPSDLPLIPDDVTPLARTLQSIADNQQVSALSDVNTDTTDHLVLLVPGGSPWKASGATSFTFTLRPPSVDLSVWDRWIADGTFNSADRATVWENFFQLNDTTDGKENLDQDPTIDDPAVNGYQFTLTRLDQNAATIQQDYQLSGVLQTGVLGLVQSQSRIVKISAAGTAASMPATASPTDPITISIPPGQVWRLTMTPVIPTVSKFSTTDFSDTAVTMTVEVATSLTLTPAASTSLHNSLVATFDSDAESISLALNPSMVPSPSLIHRVVVTTQSWRWDGRPVYSYDSLEAGYPLPPIVIKSNNLEDDLSLDGQLFGGRANDDMWVTSKPIDLAIPPPAGQNWSVFSQALESLPGALYFRFAARIYSRYEGLMNSQTYLDSQSVTSLSPTPWRRLAVPCRWAASVPVPSIKLILPLTQTVGEKPFRIDNSAPGNPGFLVVLNDPWFRESFAGLAETLECEIASIADPDPSGTGIPLQLEQFGPDPILKMNAGTVGPNQATLPGLIGPVGYTFDTDPVAPLFVKSSFFQPAPILPGQPPPPLDWYFVQLKFRRKLDSNSFPPDAYIDSPVSAWTDPMWVQILPPSDRFMRSDSTFVAVDDLSIGTGISGGTSYPAIVDQSSNPVSLQSISPDTGSRSVFALYGLQTRVVTDAFGRAAQEAYGSLFPLDATSKIPNATDQNTVIRIVELQFYSAPGAVFTPPNESTLLAALFPADPSQPAQDGTVRIVRISPPISSSTAR